QRAVKTRIDVRNLRDGRAVVFPQLISGDTIVGREVKCVIEGKSINAAAHCKIREAREIRAVATPKLVTRAVNTIIGGEKGEVPVSSPEYRSSIGAAGVDL